MPATPRTLSPRCLALLLALALGSTALVALFPATAEAYCFWDFATVIAYYSDPEMTEQVGECHRNCYEGRVCTGEETDYGAVLSAYRCPPLCQ